MPVSAPMSKSTLPSLLRALLKVCVGSAGYVAAGFAANVIAANTLGANAFGVFSLAISLLNVLQEICGSGIDLAMVRIAAGHLPDDRVRAEKVFKAAFRVKILVTLALCGALYALADTIALAVFKEPTLGRPLEWASVGLLGFALMNYQLARLQAEERFTAYAFLKAAANAAKVAALLALWQLDRISLDTVAMAWMLTFFVSYLVGMPLFAGRTRRVSGRPSRHDFSELFKFARWIIASHFLFTLYSRIDAFLLGRYWGSYEIGVYSVAWNLSFVIDLLTYSVITTLLPRAARLTTDRERSAHLKTTALICTGIAVALSPLFFLIDFVLALLFPDFGGSAEPFRILLIGGLVTLVVHPLYLILYSSNRADILTAIDFFLVLFSFCVGLYLVPRYGINGAAYTTMAGRIFGSVLIAFFVGRQIVSGKQ